MASSSIVPFAAFNSSIRLAKATKKKALARPCMATHRDYDPLPPQKVEIFWSMESYATENVLTLLKLVSRSLDIGTENNPHLWTVYTSFRERATFVPHGNTAKLAMQNGDTKLAQTRGVIAADEKRHEQACTITAKKLLEVDLDETMAAFAYMMRKKIRMPAHFIYDGQDQSLFAHFSNVASTTGVYTTMDYIEILEHLVPTWNVEKLSTGLSWKGRKAQDYMCGLAPRLRKMEERAHQGSAESKETPAPSSTITFSWISNRAV